MDKTKFIRLFPKSSLTFNGVSLGYTTGGITIRIERVFHKMKNQKYGCDVGSKLISLGATIVAPLFEYSSVTDDLIFSATTGVEPTYAELVVDGFTKENRKKTFTFYKCYVESTGDISLVREVGNTVFALVFRAVLNDAGQLYNYSGG